MGRFIFGLLVLSLGIGCGEPKQQVETSASRQIHTLKWQALIRNHQTASAYINQRVQIQLDPTEYRVSGLEVRVFANEPLMVPPAIIFKCRSKPPTGVKLVITGTCKAPIRDGVWRSRYVDFYVEVEDCTVTVGHDH